MDDTGLCSIVCSLQLWNIDNVPTHTCGCYKASILKSFQLLSVKSGALLLLSAPMLTCSTGTIKCSIQICCYNLLVMIEFSVKGRTLDPWNSRVCDEDVETPIEISYGGVDSLLHGFVRGNIDLVCFTYLIVWRLTIVAT